MSFGAKGGNRWWFGIRKDFCHFLLSLCPFLQEYANIAYSLQNDDRAQARSQIANDHSVRVPVASADRALFTLVHSSLASVTVHLLNCCTHQTIPPPS
ncbi:unnamed protein product [Timema podura]|uniref:Uncharacterized protein n=1 Tax=Timema podura TaxID=61482 RepID=A0ABN7P578_TIMPD|nr:unnamed protein product [Timema podura]